MVGILASITQVKRQRERFRKQALQREREAAIAKGNAEHLARDNQQLKRENMHLYKKIRSEYVGLVVSLKNVCFPLLRLRCVHALDFPPKSRWS